MVVYWPELDRESLFIGAGQPSMCTSGVQELWMDNGYEILYLLRTQSWSGLVDGLEHRMSSQRLELGIIIACPWI